MGIAGSVAVGVTGGALLGGAYLYNEARRDLPTAIRTVPFPAFGGALAGLGAGIAARRGLGPVAAAVAGTATAALLPAGLLAASRVGDDGWGNLGQLLLSIMIGSGTAGGGAALLGAALLRR